MEPKADIAVIGLAVMGQNLILNMNDHGFTVAAYNRTVSKVDDFLNQEAKGTNVVGAHSIEEMVALLKRPRRVMLMVKAGKAVDEFIEHLLPHLEAGDIIIDGGNSLFRRHHPPHPIRRVQRPALHRHRRFRRRRRRAPRPEHHARRLTGCLAAREGHLPGDLRQSRRRRRPAAIGWAKTAPAIS